MKITQETINKLNLDEGKKAKPIIATGKIIEKVRFTAREKAIIEELKNFAIGTRKTGVDLIASINKKHGKDFFRFSDVTTDREIMNGARYLQSEKIGITMRENSKGQIIYTRIEWRDFEALDITLSVKTIDEQKKASAEAKAKKDAIKQADNVAFFRETLAKNGYSEAEIETALTMQAIASKAVKTA